MTDNNPGKELIDHAQAGNSQKVTELLPLCDRAVLDNLDIHSSDYSPLSPRTKTKIFIGYMNDYSVIIALHAAARNNQLHTTYIIYDYLRQNSNIKNIIQTLGTYAENINLMQQKLAAELAARAKLKPLLLYVFHEKQRNKPENDSIHFLPTDLIKHILEYFNTGQSLENIILAISQQHDALHKNASDKKEEPPTSSFIFNVIPKILKKEGPTTNSFISDRISKILKNTGM